MSFGTLLESALAGFENPAPAVRLLRSASHEGLRRLAGRPLDPVENVIAVEPSSPEVLPAISAAAGVRLLEILTERPALLLEWLGLAALAQRRVSHDCLPDLLEHAAARGETHDLVMHVGGERLVWLANLNPEWRFAARIDPEQQLAQGTPTERARALRRIRREDPARGRALLEDLFDGRSERAETRSALLDALTDGLSAEDEPLLQRAVQDARKELREKGLRLIRRIPDSRFSQRWIERARTVVAFDASQSIEVHELDEPDQAWIDDGLDPRAPKGIGQAAWMLQQTLALTPPSIWPQGTLAAMQQSDWAQPLLSGLSQAAVAYADGDWCEALLLATSLHSAAALLGTLAPDRAEAVFWRCVETQPDRVGALVPGLKHAWGEDFSRRMVAFVVETPGLLHEASLRLDPRVLPEAERLLESETASPWTRPALQRLVKTLAFRLAMRQELAHA
jgi:hypothetical protein